MSIYAIGDIQGCFEQLQALLDKLNFDPCNDTLWFAGDIINRGPRSLDTLRFIYSLGEQAITVLGNHDLHLLAIANSNSKQGKFDTIQDILNAPDREQLLNWLLHRPLMHYDKTLNTCLCHAGIHPDWDIASAQSYAFEVEQILQGPESREFFTHMYGDKPETWSEDLCDWNRLRFITNAFTRMRYCNAKGALKLREKGAPSKQKKDLHPWFEINNRKTDKTNIVFGHWSTLKDPEQAHIYPLDTGCLWGGQLTALKIDEKLNNKTVLQCPTLQKIAND